MNVIIFLLEYQWLVGTLLMTTTDFLLVYIIFNATTNVTMLTVMRYKVQKYMANLSNSPY